MGILLALAGAEVTLSDQPHIVPLADANAQVGGCWGSPDEQCARVSSLGAALLALPSADQAAQR